MTTFYPSNYWTNASTSTTTYAINTTPLTVVASPIPAPPRTEVDRMLTEVDKVCQFARPATP